jgi:hypothetical protein
MHDQPQPSCRRIENNRPKPGGADNYGSKKDRLPQPSVRIGRLLRSARLSILADGVNGPKEERGGLSFDADRDHCALSDR